MTFWGEISSWSQLQPTVRKYLIRSCSQHSAAEKLELTELLEDRSIDPIKDELSFVGYQLQEIRKEKGGRKTYHTMVAAYFSDLAKTWQALRARLREGGEVAFVVGDSAPYGIYVPVEQWLGELAIAAGFNSYNFVKFRERNVKWKNRKHSVPLKEGVLWIQG